MRKEPEWLTGLARAASHQLIPPFTAEAQTIAKVADTTTTQRQTIAAL